MKQWKRMTAMTMAGAIAVMGFAGTASADSNEGLTTLRILGVDHMVSAGTETVYLSDWVNKESKLWQKMTEELAARGVALEVDLIKDDQYQVVLQTQIAAGLDYDIVNITPLDTQTRFSLVDQGKLLPLNEIWENYSEGGAKEFFESGNGAKEVKMLSMEDGNIYWLTDVSIGCYGDLSTGGVLGFLIRKDWLDKLGMEIPTTTDELFDTLVAFQEQDANGNGEKDEVVSLSLENFGTGVAQWFGLGPEITYINKETGTIETPWYQENVKDYIEFMQRLYNAGLLDTSDQGSQKKTENKIAGLYSWSLENWEEPSIIYPEGEEAPCYVGVLADAVEGKEPYIPRQEAYQLGWTATAVTSQCEHPEAVAKLLDYITSEDYWMLTEYGIEGYTYQVNDEGRLEKINGDDLEQKVMFSNMGLWANGGIFPRYGMVEDRVDEIAKVEEAGYGEKVPYCVEGFSYEYAIPHETQPNLAIKTAEQTEKLSAIETDLNTYSQELLLKLIFGQKDLGDWDTYLDDLKRLGLDEKIAIEQDCLDRTK